MIEGDKLGIFANEKNNLPIESFERGLRFAEDVAAERSKGFVSRFRCLVVQARRRGTGFRFRQLKNVSGLL